MKSTSKSNSYEHFFKEAQKNVHNRSQLQKRKILEKSNSWKFVIISALGFILAGSGLLYMDEIERFIKKTEISLLGLAHAENKTTETIKTEPSKAENAISDKADKDGKSEKIEEDSKKVFTNEEINHFSKLNERKRELDSREEELNRMESELQNQKIELEKKMVELENTRRNIASVLNDRVKADNEKIDILVQVYSTMKPQQAAKVFETMDEDLAVEILGRMKKKSSAEIMNLLKAEKTQIFSEKFAGYKKK